jgi:hypothetical protein
VKPADLDIDRLSPKEMREVLNRELKTIKAYLRDFTSKRDFVPHQAI